MPEALLKVRNLACTFGNDPSPIFSNLQFDVYDGDIVVLSGRSGSGKTTLLKCIAHLNPHEGDIWYRGRLPTEYGVPFYRTKILYVPQRPSLLPGTPRQFLETVQRFNSRKNDTKHIGGPIDLAKSWGIDEELWDREWASLSGGEGQRVALAVAMGLKTAEVLLLDEPTSALDAETSSLVEKSLLSEIESDDSILRTIICITHSSEQGKRIGTNFLSMESLTVHEGENQDAV